MSVLFDKGTDHPSKRDLIRVLKWGREQFDHSEDDWKEKELSLVRDQLGPQWSTYSTFELKNKLIRLRKDKLVRKSILGKPLRTRLGKVARDYDRFRNQRGFSHHSDEYDEWIHSDEWRKKASEHRRLCQYKCQLCGSEAKLEVHHTPLGYSFLGSESTEHLMALCHECHVIADMIRAINSK